MWPKHSAGVVELARVDVDHPARKLGGTVGVRDECEAYASVAENLCLTLGAYPRPGPRRIVQRVLTNGVHFETSPLRVMVVAGWRSSRIKTYSIPTRSIVAPPPM